VYAGCSMSLQSCVNQALEAGRLTKEEADNLLNQSGIDEDLIIRGAIEDKIIKKRQTALQALALDDAIKKARSHKHSLNAGVMSLIVRDITNKAEYSNIDARSLGIFGDYQRELTDMMDAYRSKLAGLKQDKEGARKMVRELFEESTGDANASAFAKAWSKVSERARVRFNRAGGNIKNRKDWRLPQHHDPLMVGRAGFDDWFNDVNQLIEPLTDSLGRELTPEKAREALRESWDAIRTGGASKINPGAKGGSKLANRRQDERVFSFKDADSWLAYQDKYGSKDIYSMMQDHLRAIANDTAMLEVLGPNPNAAFKFLQDLQKKEGVNPRNLQFQEAVFREQTGMGSLENVGRVASVLGATRNVISSALLGGAWLSAWSDAFFIRQGARFNGLPTTKIMKRMMKNFAGSAEGRKDAVRVGLVAEAWLSRSIGASRYTEVYGKGITAKMNDFVMRSSLLSPWTEAGRTAFGMEFAAHFAKNAVKNFDQLDEGLRGALKRAGISGDEWNVIRSAKPTDIKGSKFLATEAIQGLDIPQNQKDDLSSKFMGMILQESDVAVPTPGARERAIASGMTQKGTIPGELFRTAIMFKSFPVTLLTTHLYRGAMMNKKMDRVAYLGAMVAGTTIIGGLSLQAKDIAKGKDPRNMNDDKFWLAALTQGGGLGIMGDFFFSDQNRFGGGLASSMMGPAIGMTDDFGKLTVGNIQQAAKGEDTNAAGEAIKFGARYTPGGSLWYLRLAVERGIIDQLALLADPKMKKKFAAAEKRQKRDYGNKFWWKPGKATPSRAPDLEEAIK
jgi:hypothetical protein